MKNSKIKLLSVAACLVLVGTASAAWAYAGTATQSASIGVKVAAYADAGTITISDTTNIKVLLDKDTVTYEGDSITATYAKPTGFESATNSVTYKYKLTISPALYKYVTFADSVSNTVTDGEGDNALITTDFQYTWVSGTAISVNSLPALKWQDNKCPTDESTYKTLVSTICTGYDENLWDDSKTNTWNAKADYSISIIFNAEVGAAA